MIGDETQLVTTAVATAQPLQFVLAIKPRGGLLGRGQIVAVRYLPDRGEIELLVETNNPHYGEFLDGEIRLSPDGPIMAFELCSTVGPPCCGVCGEPLTFGEQHDHMPVSATPGE